MAYVVTEDGDLEWTSRRGARTAGGGSVILDAGECVTVVTRDPVTGQQTTSEVCALPHPRPRPDCHCKGKKKGSCNSCRGDHRHGIDDVLEGRRRPNSEGNEGPQNVPKGGWG
jgi:hypothetical protein